MPRPYGRNYCTSLPTFTHLQVEHTELLDLLRRAFLYLLKIQQSKSNIALQIYDSIRLSSIVCSLSAEYVNLRIFKLADTNLS